MGRVCVLLACAAACCASTVLRDAAPLFGHSLLPLFGLRANYTNLNFGSYGSVPATVLDAATALEREVEASPDEWFRYKVFDRMDALRRRLAALIGVDPLDLVFVPNASAGVNAIVRSVKVPPGRTVLRLNLAYTMVKNVIAFEDPTSVLVVNVTWPSDDDAIVAAVASALDAHPSVYLASFSHIVSLPGVILPVARLAAACRARGVLVLIDGAHALGHVPLNIPELGADFWLGNAHKWLFGPKGSAVLWVRREVQHLIEPPVISWEGQGGSHFQLAFSYTGTASYSPYLALDASLDFRAALGGEAAIQAYTHDLAVQGGALLAAAWGTDVLFSDAARYGAMVDVRAPTRNATLAAALPAALLARFGTWVPFYDLGSLGGETPNTFYVRVSFQVFSELSDAQMLADAVLTLVAESEADAGRAVYSGTPRAAAAPLPVTAGRAAAGGSAVTRIDS